MTSTSKVFKIPNLPISPRPPFHHQDAQAASWCESQPFGTSDRKEANIKGLNSLRCTSPRWVKKTQEMDGNLEIVNHHLSNQWEMIYFSHKIDVKPWKKAKMGDGWFLQAVAPRPCHLGEPRAESPKMSHWSSGVQDFISFISLDFAVFCSIYVSHFAFPSCCQSWYLGHAQGNHIAFLL